MIIKNYIQYIHKAFFCKDTQMNNSTAFWGLRLSIFLYCLILFYICAGINF